MRSTGEVKKRGIDGILSSSLANRKLHVKIKEDKRKPELRISKLQFIIICNYKGS